MSHTITYNQETNIIETKARGDITLDEIKEMISEFALVVKETGSVLILTDYREATIRLSTTEIYSIHQILSDIFDSLGLKAQRIKRALVIAGDSRDYLFSETVAYNRGQNTKVFYNIDEAKKWLTGQGDQTGHLGD